MAREPRPAMPNTAFRMGGRAPDGHENVTAAHLRTKITWKEIRPLELGPDVLLVGRGAAFYAACRPDPRPHRHASRLPRLCH